MYESIIEKIYYVVHNTVTNPILWITVLYLIIFIILTLLKFWEGIFDDGVSYIKNIIYFIYLPVLLVCCIMGFFSDTAIGMVKNYTPSVVQSLFKIIFFPLLLLEIIGKKISRKNLSDRFLEKESKNLHNKLKVYQQCTKNLVNIDASFLKDYYWEILFKVLALLLQIVSFFTTYAGVELFFGDLFSFSTLFVTLAIQVGLFITSISVNKPGKKNFRGKFLMIILLVISITFSYIGLITMVSSPEETYKAAYEEYKTYFDNNINLNSGLNSKEKTEAKIKNELKSIVSTLNLFNQKIIENINQKKNFKKTGKPNEFVVVKKGKNIRKNDGTIIQMGDIVKKNPDYDRYNNTLMEYKNKISGLIQRRYTLVNDISNITGEKLKKYKKRKKQKSYYTNMNYAKIEKIIENASLDALFNEEDNNNKSSWTKENCIRFIKKNNSALEYEHIKDKSSDEYKINEELIDNEIEKYKKGSAIDKVVFDEWDKFKEEILSHSDENKGTIADKALYVIGSSMGADLDNNKMHNLIGLLQEIQNKVESNYNVVSSLDELADTKKLSELENKKKKVEQIPNLFFIGFNRFAQEGKHRNNAYICLILAFLNDFLTIILGLAGSRKAFSFLYVKSSKDYYNDIDELFGIVFKSMMQEFYISIRRGEFNNMDSSEFMEKCIQVVQKTSNAISSFLNRFLISECTSSMGYNLYFKYKTENEIKSYRPIISVLLKTNMLKVMPYVYYRHLELEYYCGTKLPAWENDLGKDYESSSNSDYIEFENYKELLDTNKSEGNVLLLRNRAENYLRENMYVDIKVTEDEPIQYISQVNGTIESK